MAAHSARRLLAWIVSSVEFFALVSNSYYAGSVIAAILSA
jgi:hypothetical protein